MDIDDFIPVMNEHAPPALRKLGGRIHAFDDESGTVEMRYTLDDSFTHSGGIVQGGYVTGTVMTPTRYPALPRASQKVRCASRWAVTTRSSKCVYRRGSYVRH
mgnify:CR=1 FL=1